MYVRVYMLQKRLLRFWPLSQ